MVTAAEALYIVDALPATLYKVGMDFTNSSEWDLPTFPVAVAAKAGGIPPGTLRMWFVRGQVPQLDQPIGAEPAKDGLPRLLTYRSVLLIAAAGALTGQGVSPTEAIRTAQHWTGVGTVEGGKLVRAPGALFSSPALTLLSYRKGGPGVISRGAVRDGAVSLPLQAYLSTMQDGGAPVSTLVLLNIVEQRARAAALDYLGERAGEGQTDA